MSEYDGSHLPPFNAPPPGRRASPNGGPAFPSTAPCAQVGVSMLDYFAGQALQGVLASGRAPLNQPPEGFAQQVYLIAEAMLVERARRAGAV